MEVDDTHVITSLKHRWCERRAEFERLIMDRFRLERINDLLRLGRATRPLQIPGTPWFCWTHGIGVRIALGDETGGIDFDFDKPGPDLWRLRSFAQRQIEEHSDDAEILRHLTSDPPLFERFERAYAAAADAD